MKTDVKYRFSIVNFTKPLKTSLWAVWAEQNAHYTQNFCPRPAVPYVKLRAYSPNMYTVLTLAFSLTRFRLVCTK